MGTILHLFVALSAALVHTGPGYATVAAPAVDRPVAVAAAIDEVPPRLEIAEMPDELLGTVVWAIGLFERADLTLPPLQFVYHGDDQDRCGGYRGVHELRGDRSVIGLCMTEVSKVNNATVLHEVAHAWLEHELTAERQAEFQALRGYDRWRDHGAHWGAQGCEQAAEIMVWGLIDRPIGFVTFENTGCDALEAGYRTLTGSAPLHGYRDLC